ncbi:hypothetical protein B7463_g103, partial [Scytalidium lignicola]
MSFEFVNLSGPRIEEKSTRTRVRSHVTARNHAVNREVRKRFARRPTKHAPLRMRSRVPAVEGGIIPNPLEHLAPAFTYPAIAHTPSPLPSPVTPLSASSRDPFDCLAVAYNPAESYLLDHYVTYLFPRFNLYRFDDPLHSSFTHDMIHKWLPFALTDPSATSSVFLLAARSLAGQYQSEKFHHMALVYRLRCIQAVNNALSSEVAKTSDATIISILGLSSDEVSFVFKMTSPTLAIFILAASNVENSTILEA